MLNTATVLQVLLFALWFLLQWVNMTCLISSIGSVIWWVKEMSYPLWQFTIIKNIISMSSSFLVQVNLWDALSKLLCGGNILYFNGTWSILVWKCRTMIILFTWNCLSILLNCDGGRSYTTCYAMVEALILLVMQ